jgi:branched-chain amino acid aminotransferase
MQKFNYEKGVAFMRDKFVPFSDANVSIGSSPVLYGLAIYTVFGVIWNKENKSLSVFRLEDHFKRLQNSAKTMDFHGFLETWTYEKFEKMVFDLIKKNKLEEDALVRVSVFIDANLAGTKIHGLKNSVSAYVYPLGEILPRNGVNVCVSSWTRVSSKAIPVNAKVNGSYVNSSLMKNEALLKGFHDAIALDEKGNICEGTVANLFFVKKGKLVTPSVDFDLLHGITRRTIIELAKDLNIKVEERAIKPKELGTFEEAFFCGSSARITPILSIDKKRVGDGEIGKVTELLIKKYQDALLGIEPKYSKWLKVIK